MLTRFTLLFAMSLVLTSALVPQHVQAQGPVPQIVSDPPLEAWVALQEPKTKIKSTLAAALLTHLVNLMTFAADRLAYDAAVMVASGGPAESPLFDGRPVDQYFKDFGADVAGESIGLLQQDLERSGGALGDVFSSFNLCQPRADITIALSLGIKGVFERKPPKCDAKAVLNNWKGFVADIADEGSADNKNKLILTQLVNSFDPQTNEFSVGIELQSSILNKALQDSFLKANVHVKEGGFGPVIDVITGNIETPAEVINYTYKDRGLGSGAPDVAFKSLQIFGNNPDILPQVAMHAGSVFTNTLLSEFTQKLYTGLFDFNGKDIDPFAGIESLARGNAQDAREQYRSLLTASPIELTNYSILGDFSSCPSGVQRGLYNCVANNSFVSAIGRADAGAPVTIEEALELGLLSGSWPLIPSSDLARNQDPFCYTYGFCHTNLVKLRKARVISIGWELAAESMYNTAGDAVTLQEVVDGFSSCNAAGEADGNHPWCKLIDPNWILKYPEMQCKALVNGQLLITSAVNERQQECVDMPSCIAENDDGTCTGGYGYCVKEENVWRFRGESCPVQYASCLTFEGEDKTVSYLETTVDFADCTADNAGCLWYDTQKADPEGDGTYDWQVVEDMAAADVAPDAFTSRIYFTGDVAECDSANGGCSELYQRDSTLSLNVIQNPGFEADTNNDATADGWMRNNNLVSVDVPEIARTGSKAVSLGSSNVINQPGIAVSQGRFYTLSFYARQKLDGAVANAVAALEFVAVEPGNDINLNGTSFIAGTATTCGISNSGNTINGNGLGDVLAMGGTPAGVEFERYTCTFTSPIIPDSSSLILGKLSLRGNVYVDDVQLEQGEIATDYHAGYSVSQPATITVKVPPAYLGCQGNASDPAECANYAQVCSENEVGCTAYTPTNGDPTVTGVATELDACPAMCVGYDTFKQEPTLYEPAGDFPVYFIPESGESCSEEYAGCDEFTNLSNEALEYYTYLRACVTPPQADLNTNSDGSATFYTWEGSDLEGYQLRTWILLESNRSSSPYTYISGGVDSTPHLAPCSVWTATATGIVCSDERDSDGDLKKDWDTASCDDHDDIFTNPDCREFYDTDGGIHYREWSNTVTVNETCTAYRKTELVGSDALAQTANCQNSGGFFDAATGTCRYSGYSEESLECPDSANGCRSYTGGRSRNSRVVLNDTLEGGNLNNWDAASAADVTLSNESLATGGHSIAATNQFSTFIFDFDKACPDPGGCPGTANTLGGSCVVIAGEQYCGTLEDELFQGKTYTLSFWAKGSGSLTTGFDLAASSGSAVADVPFGTVELTSGWQQFSLGPLNMTASDYPLFGLATTLVFDPTDLAYIDNITLREGEDSITLIKDSWVTPAACDQSPTGAISPQYYLGCQEYRTQDSQTAYLKSFSRLCDSSKVGCEDFFMTHESSTPHAQVFQATCTNPSGAAVTSPTACYYETIAGAFNPASQYLCTIGVGQISCDFDINWYESRAALPAHITYGPSTTVVPADSDVFLVVNDGVTCSSASAGCQEVGKPKWSQDRNSTDGADSVFLMNDPDRYSDILCNQGELFCAAWSTDNDGTFYFKDPADQTCGYRTNVLIGGVNYNGWFRSGTDEFCYGTCSDGVTSCSSDAECGTGICDTQDPSYLVNGTLSSVWRNGDNNYGGWVGQCESKYSSCSEFQDPLDIQTSEQYQVADGEKYFYLNNDNLDENVLPSSQRCDGKVSLKEGCVLFNDTSEPSQGYSASATEMLSTHADKLAFSQPFALVNPINCETGSSGITLADGTVVDLCAQRCLYDKGRVLDISVGGNRSAKLDREVNQANPDLFGFDDLYLTGTSCYDVSDCGTMRNESGQEIKALDCATSARITREDANNGVEERANVPRLENDTNTILKVNRDRQCSEWLSCAEDQASWDERTNSWKTVCTDVELCTKYSSVGGTTFCSEWKSNGAELVINDEVYTDRDVSWYGQEFSGYAIPGLFPVQSLEQAKVSPPSGFCDLSSVLLNTGNAQANYDAYHGNPCTNETACGGDPGISNYCVTDDAEDYRLALIAGSCEGDFATACSVGYCEKTGSACAATSDCGSQGGSCMVGSCQTQTTTLCASDSNCSDSQICSGGLCVTPGADVSIDGDLGTPNDDFDANNPNASCSAGQVFASNIALQTGSCIRGQCLLTPDGYTFDTATTEGKLCRAYPEVNSPFSDELVERWLDSSTGKPGDTNASAKGIDDVPYQVRTGFEAANFCAPGEDCSCSYRKLTFGQGAVRYWDADTQVPDNLGICVSGSINKACTGDEECGDPVVEGACALVTREDVLLGLDGYCLEKDTGININGDRDQGACLTWLPVDQLAGSTDMYAKSTEAGYFEDAFACSYTAPFVNLTMSDHPPLHAIATPGSYGSIACADITTNGTDIERDEAFTVSVAESCARNITCPQGYWALAGMPSFVPNGNDGSMSAICADAPSGDANDCPYVCIPFGATMLDANLDVQSCDPENTEYMETLFFEIQNTLGITTDIGFGLGDLPQDTQMMGAEMYTTTTVAEALPLYQSFDLLVDKLSACSLKAVELTPLVEDIFELPRTNGVDFDINGDGVINGIEVDMGARYRNLSLNGEFYAACKEVVQVVDEASYSGYPWTDKINTSKLKFPSTESLISSIPGLSFLPTTPPVPFGFTGEKPVTTVPTDGKDNWPFVIATCEDTVGRFLHQPFGVSLTDCLGFGQQDYTRGDSTAIPPGEDLRLRLNPVNPMARSLVEFIYSQPFSRVDSWQAAMNSNPYSIINQLFASVNIGTDNSYIWNDIDNDGSSDNSWPKVDRKYSARYEYHGQSVHDVRAEEGNPPKVWSLASGTCVGWECAEGEENSLTLNDQNFGDVSASNFLRAYLKFYAAADKNQLPIRRVIVDWGDGLNNLAEGFQGSESPNNFYKNHRGLNTNTDLSICESGNEWGQTSESCDPNYFSYSHVYTCSTQITSDAARGCQTDPTTGIITNSPCWVENGSQKSCVFQPRVHIRDNWGWCTGVCPNGVDGSNGCFEGDGDDNDTLLYPGDPNSECGYAYRRSPGAPIDPWVYYDGTVIVNPN